MQLRKTTSCVFKKVELPVTKGSLRLDGLAAVMVTGPLSFDAVSPGILCDFSVIFYGFYPMGNHH